MQKIDSYILKHFPTYIREHWLKRKEDDVKKPEVMLKEIERGKKGKLFPFPLFPVIFLINTLKILNSFTNT